MHDGAAHTLWQSLRDISLFVEGARYARQIEGN